MTARQLLIRRIRAHANKQWKTWRLILDWTVILYGVLPLIAFFIYHYRLLWRGELEWVTNLPLLFWIILFWISFLHDRFFIWVERADMILLSDRSLIRTIKQFSVRYHLIKFVLKYAVLVGLFIPILVLKGWSVLSGAGFGLYILLLAGVHAWSVYQLKIRQKNWLWRFSISFLILIYMSLTVPRSLFLPIGLLLLGLAVYLGRGWMKKQAYVSREVEVSEAVRLAFDQALLSTTGAIEKPSRRKRPFYRPDPDRFGTVQRTVAILLYIRTPRHRNLWLRLLPISTAGLFALPSFFKLVIVLYVMYVAYQERQAFKREMERHPFFRALKKG